MNFSRGIGFFFVTVVEIPEGWGGGGGGGASAPYKNYRKFREVVGMF